MSPAPPRPASPGPPQPASVTPPWPSPGAAPAQPAASPAPPPPPAAEAVFGPVLDLARRYAGLLAGPGVQRGLLGPRETSRLWERHLLNCAAVADLVPHPCSAVDLGSGAGLPGIVIAMLLPDVHMVLLEPMARRAAFLTECVEALGLRNTAVCRRRAEEVSGQLAADVVVARAVAPMERLAVLSLGLVRPGGLVLAMKGARAAGELARARPVLERLRAKDAAVVQAGSGKVSPPLTVVRLTAPAARRAGRPGLSRAAGGRTRAREQRGG